MQIKVYGISLLQRRNKLTLLYGALISIIMFSACDQKNPYTGLNSPPQIPQAIYPAPDTSHIDVDITFRWSGGDPNSGDVVKYNFYLQANNPSPYLIADNLTEARYHPDSLKFETTYYWRIIAIDNNGSRTKSPVWQFTTRSETNNPPFAPIYQSPPDGADHIAINQAILQWSGSDPDSMQSVSYTILLDINNPPQNVLIAGYDSTTLHLPLLNYDTRYYWQVIVRDIYGLETAGPVWSFLTTGRDIFINDHFDGYPVGPYSPPDSLWLYSGTSNSAIQIVDHIYYGDAGKSCLFIDNSIESSNYLAASLKFPKTIGVLEFAWRVDHSDDFLGVRLYGDGIDTSHRGPQLSIRGDSLAYYDQLKNWRKVCDIDSMQWYHMLIAFDCELGVYSIFVNDKLLIPDATWPGKNIDKIYYLYFLTFSNRRCRAGYIDEVMFYSE